jgi:DNA-binding NtrC family response regulator
MRFGPTVALKVSGVRTGETVLDRTGERVRPMNVEPNVSALEAASVALCGCEQDELKPVAAILGEIGCVVHPAETINQLDELLQSTAVDVIVVHVCPSRQQFLPILGRAGVPPVVPLLRHADRHLYLELLRRGAFDCVPLPVQKGELKRVLSLAIGDPRKQIVVSNAA